MAIPDSRAHQFNGVAGTGKDVQVVAGGAQVLSFGQGLGLYYGSGAPTVTAAKGSLYIRTDGSSAATRMYINSTGAAVWVACTTAS